MNTWNSLVPTLVASTEGSGGESHEIGLWILLFILLIIGIIMYMVTQARAGYGERVFTNPWSQRAEQLYVFLKNFAVGIIGPHGVKYMPVLATFWLFIFTANIFGLFLPTPTALLSTNLGLAIVAVVYVQYEGIKANGLLGHLKHFTGPKMVGPMVLISGLIFMIEVISEAMKLVSLTLRLYGNIHGGHEVVVQMNKLVVIQGYEIPVGGILLPIKVLTCLIQAMVFCLLLSVYLGMVTHHEEDHDDHSGSDSLHGTPVHA